MLVCKICGGSNIEQKVWADVNDDTVLDSVFDGDIEDNWCRDCEEHVKFIIKEEYVRKTSTSS